MTRDEAYELLTTHLKTENLVKHCLATEAIMRALAPRFDGDPELWGITGLLHDLDLDLVDADPKLHATKTAEIVAAAGLDEPYVEAIRRHNAEELGLTRETDLDHALAAAETITGLVTATALVYPDRKLASVKPKSITKRFKSARFAAGANREIIMECEKIGIPLPEFAALSLEAMKGVADQLGL
jgi:uncharacterized protein